jgi:hypothetical protein
MSSETHSLRKDISDGKKKNEEEDIRSYWMTF